jgi:hypothetical protein
MPDNKFHITIVVIIVSILPLFLYSQTDKGRVAGGRFKFEYQYYKTFPLGTQNYFELEFAANYMYLLCPAFLGKKCINRFENDNYKLYSPIGTGFKIGFNGGYSNTDSLNMHGSEFFFGPLFRYFTKINLFLEVSGCFRYSCSKIWSPLPLPGTYYIPLAKSVGYEVEIGLGYRIKLNRNIAFEPVAAYQIIDDGYYIDKLQNSQLYHENLNNLNFYVGFQYYF